MELTSILLNICLLLVLSILSGAGFGSTSTKLFFQSILLGRVLQLLVNNTILRWLMGKGVMDAIRLWGWMKVRYDSDVKLEPLKLFYEYNMGSLKLKVNGSFVGFFDLFHGLAILQ